MTDHELVTRLAESDSIAMAERGDGTILLVDTRTKEVVTTLGPTIFTVTMSVEGGRVTASSSGPRRWRPPGSMRRRGLPFA
jgi:hypothetical protein